MIKKLNVKRQMESKLIFNILDYGKIHLTMKATGAVYDMLSSYQKSRMMVGKLERNWVRSLRNLILL